jgi:RHS repeat-associated protein
LITASVGNVAPTYDPAGNMTTLPKDPGGSTAQYDLRWDAWNRLVQVKDGTTTVASYAYDGLFRRTTKTTAAETRHYYYNDQWRALEERVEGATAAVDRQYTWGLRDRWDLLRRKRSTGSSSLNEVHFCLRDYLDPVAIVGTDGIVKERYAYDAFGNVRFLAPDYSSRSSSFFAWEFLFHAEFRDADTELYNYGFRYYNPALGRWLSTDPLGEQTFVRYTGGTFAASAGGALRDARFRNSYMFVRNRAVRFVDRFGLAIPTVEEIIFANDQFPNTGYCGCAFSLCEALARAIKQVEDAASDYTDAIGFLKKNAVKIEDALRRRYESVLGCDAKMQKKKVKDEHLCEICNGYNASIVANGQQNFRHYLYGVFYTNVGANYQYYNDQEQYWDANTDERRDENQAEMVADAAAAEAWTEIITALKNSPNRPWYESPYASDKAWAAEKGIISEIWKREFCTG